MTNSNFLEIRFPTDISYGSSGGPEYQTEVIVMNSGYEQRNINWNNARHSYNVAYGVRSKQQLESLIDFFHICKGRAFGFRFKDWHDYKATSQVITLADGINNQFQTIKNYQISSYQRIRIINKLVQNTVNIYLNGIKQIDGYQIDYNTGIIAFDEVPAENSIISADFEFDVPVRFDSDKISSVLDNYNSNSSSNISLIEIRI